MIKRFIIVKKYDADGVRYNDRMYWAGEEVGFVSDVRKSLLYGYRLKAEFDLEEMQESGTFQIETVYNKP